MAQENPLGAQCVDGEALVASMFLSLYQVLNLARIAGKNKGATA